MALGLELLVWPFELRVSVFKFPEKSETAPVLDVASLAGRSATISFETRSERASCFFEATLIPVLSFIESSLIEVLELGPSASIVGDFSIVGARGPASLLNTVGFVLLKRSGSVPFVGKSGSL